MAVTPWSLGMKLQLTRSAAAHALPSAERPLVLLSGWMGSTANHLKHYRAAWHDRGFDTMAFSAGPQEVLQPKKAIRLMESVLDAAAEEAGAKGAAEAGTTRGGRPILWHGFSMSGYLFGNALLSMDAQPERFAAVRRNLRAQIFDSPPDFNGIAGGVARSMGFGGVRELLIRGALSSYLEATKDTAGVLHRASSERFHGNDLSGVPSLWFYSESDPVARAQDCRTVIGKWRAAGIEVDEEVFQDTPHVQHMRLQPEKYLGALDLFLEKHGLPSANTNTANRSSGSGGERESLVGTQPPKGWGSCGVDPNALLKLK
jgi:hypothetical protein